MLRAPVAKGSQGRKGKLQRPWAMGKQIPLPALRAASE